MGGEPAPPWLRRPMQSAGWEAGPGEAAGVGLRCPGVCLFSQPGQVPSPGCPLLGVQGTHNHWPGRQRAWGPRSWLLSIGSAVWPFGRFHMARKGHPAGPQVAHWEGAAQANPRPEHPGWAGQAPPRPAGPSPTPLLLQRLALGCGVGRGPCLRGASAGRAAPPRASSLRPPLPPQLRPAGPQSPGP